MKERLTRQLSEMEGKVRRMADTRLWAVQAVGSIARAWKAWRFRREVGRRVGRRKKVR